MNAWVGFLRRLDPQNLYYFLSLGLKYCIYFIFNAENQSVYQPQSSCWSNEVLVQTYDRSGMRLFCSLWQVISQSLQRPAWTVHDSAIADFLAMYNRDSRADTLILNVIGVLPMIQGLWPHKTREKSRTIIHP